MAHEGTPRWQHDCKRCRFLGQTIGGGRLHDLYVHERDDNRSPTVIARYGDDRHDYYAIDVNYAHTTGHSELFAAAHLWRQSERED